MDLIEGILKELARLKLRDIKAYDPNGKSILADYFFLSTADSIIQLEAVRNNLIRYMKNNKISLKNGMEEWHGGWCLLDFGEIIIHIFLEERRSFYQIDRLMESSEYTLMETSSLTAG
jgi:ribosome-associated protein